MDDYLKSISKENAALEKAAKKFPIPEGFVSSWKEEPFRYNGQTETCKQFVLKNEALEVEFIFRAGGGGTTRFKTERGWLTFDRRGVEDSFYWVSLFDTKEKVDVAAIIQEQLERVAKRREYYKTAITIPDVGYTSTPEGVVELKAKLVKQGRITFFPSGFGTGYNVVKKTKQRYGVRRAKPELEEFFGISPLFVESFDAD